jgi:tagatose 1,6-diphosphate aldolase
MAKIQMTRGKFEGLMACSNAAGVIAAVAIDQRGSLQKSITKARGEGDACTSVDLVEFKRAIVKVLSPHASALLIDPEYGLEALREIAPKTGVLLAYEKTGYDASLKGRLPDLLPAWSVRRLLEAGADAIKILLYYNSADARDITEIKHAFIERIGAECVAHDVPFFLEPIYYDDSLEGDGQELARRKPEMVLRYMEEFSKPQYAVDILKVEVPVNMKYVKGTKTCTGDYVCSQAEALEFFRQAAEVAKKPFIYLSAGVSDDVFRETLELAIEAGTSFSGILCGRATWQDGIPVFAQRGYDALVDWLAARGVENIAALNTILSKGAKPWWDVYGGLENIEVG